ncbi:hypothetical protein [Ruminococcus sp. HUN007]|uniref:hypothetical protein n=1 Tax=Ruminococcus sp. HUN007 TaxID=1514668 RepID=UPI0005D17573|nr:hypothetical protein [Ruminococcus sp. HUN007]
MRKYLTAYLAYADRILAEKDPEKIGALREEHLKQIAFMQHERHMHLIVMALFALMLFIAIGILACTENITYAVLTGLLLVLLIPYVFHYYFLENSVQKMYRQYNEMTGTGLPDDCRQSGNRS